MLVLDASAAFDASQFQDGFDAFAGERLVAPPLMRSEVRSAWHEAVWRGDAPLDRALMALRSIEHADIRFRSHPKLDDEAWRLADEFGWAKTYDAEYVALAFLLHCNLVTADERLRRGTARLGFVIGPSELRSRR